MTTAAEVRSALADVLDPEYPVSLVDMGLVRDVEVVDGTARVTISYCSLGCPCIQLIEQDVEERLLALEGVDRVEVIESYELWTRRDISRRGLRQLRLAGVG
ncbi:MAG TPA: iron-sulfur cluster assembly protein [Gaiella sp.]|nr:iron-sulfur cluster assembly protein [Gaiella sp.]